MLLRVIDNKIDTFPIAGTRAITNNENQNRKLKNELLRIKRSWQNIPCL
jgi:anthranilate/para-aminobenzoate synthase component I